MVGYRIIVDRTKFQAVPKLTHSSHLVDTALSSIKKEDTTKNNQPLHQDQASSSVDPLFLPTEEQLTLLKMMGSKKLNPAYGLLLYNLIQNKRIGRINHFTREEMDALERLHHTSLTKEQLEAIRTIIWESPHPLFEICSLQIINKKENGTYTLVIDKKLRNGEERPVSISYNITAEQFKRIINIV